MELWAWLVAYLLGFALLQLYLYRYFIKGGSANDSATEGATPAYSEGGASGVEHTDRSGGGDLVACSQCGTYNEREAAFTFCKECGERLSR